MSIGNNHVFSKLDKNSKPLDGQRLVRLIAKGKDKPEHLQESLCVSIPVTNAETVAERINDLLPFVVGMVHDTQDKIIREFRIEHGHDSVNENVFSMDAVIGWLAENATGERVTAAYLREWITEDYGDAAKEWIGSLNSSQGLGADALAHKFNVLVDLFAMFADPRAKFNKLQLNAVLAFANAVEQDGRMSIIAAKAQKTLDDILKAEQEAEEMFL